MDTGKSMTLEQMALKLKKEHADFPIWHLLNTKPGAVNLYKCDDTNYVVTEDGYWSSIISCGLFIFIKQELLSFFQQNLDEPIASVAVSIYDRALKQYFEGYSRIYIKDLITPENLLTVDHAGYKVWHYEGDGGIFISKDLKDKFEQADIPHLAVVPGFALYAGK